MWAEGDLSFREFRKVPPCAEGVEKGSKRNCLYDRVAGSVHFYELLLRAACPSLSLSLTNHTPSQHPLTVNGVQRTARGGNLCTLLECHHSFDAFVRSFGRPPRSTLSGLFPHPLCTSAGHPCLLSPKLFVVSKENAFGRQNRRFEGDASHLFRDTFGTLKTVSSCFLLSDIVSVLLQSLE